MMQDKYFYYYQHIAEIDIIETLPVYIDNIHTEEDILCLYNKQLRFPSYFGNNWDALKDILCYLNEWINFNTIVIINCDNLFLSEKDFSIYIDILYAVCEIWEKYPDELSFKVFFPEKFREMIQSIR